MSTVGGRELLLVAGVGRSGTSLMTGVLGQLGFHVPQPEVKADDTNPRGFSEPRWVVDFHQRLLRGRRITVNDARPGAWESAATAVADAEALAELREWLAAQLEQSAAVVVKDPRTSWFLPLWMRCAADLDVPTSFVTMLRHPAEIIASAQKSYGTKQSGASRAASWVNVTLETEHATRGARRAFVRYEDLLTAWQPEIRRVGGLLEVPWLADVDPARAAEVDAFVDPSLHRNRVGWDELDVPPRMRDMVEDVWREVQPLAAPAGDTPELRGRLDAARAEYAGLYAEAEAIAYSSIAAAAPRKPKPEAVAAPAPAPAPPSLRVRLARRVPVAHRRRIRRALGALRRS
jgi:hypothetical protein